MNSLLLYEKKDSTQKECRKEEYCQTGKNLSQELETKTETLLRVSEVKEDHFVEGFHIPDIFFFPCASLCTEMHRMKITFIQWRYIKFVFYSTLQKDFSDYLDLNAPFGTPMSLQSKVAIGKKWLRSFLYVLIYQRENPHQL